jgi:purine-binding chemotaxis protein CheW
MDEQFFLVFELGQTLYGLPAEIVQELLFLPELTPIPEALSEVVGVLNLRGVVLPVIDLSQRLGKRRMRYSLSDSLIVVEHHERRLGVIVNQIHDVKAIASNQMATATAIHDLADSRSDRLTGSIAHLDSGMITLLNPQSLLQLSLTMPPVPPAAVEPSMEPSGEPQDNPFHHFSPEDREILKQRAKNLSVSLEEKDAAGLIPFAVVGLGNEIFGMGLEAVYEFIDVQKITPIPCCPPHIVGNTNLRGEVITLIDIRNAIDLIDSHDSAAENYQKKHGKKAIVARLDGVVAGITVDDIFDVLYLDAGQMMNAPVAIHSISDEYLQGIIPYKDRMMSIINLPRLLHSGELVVDEEP